MSVPAGFKWLGVVGYHDSGMYDSSVTYNKYNVVGYNGSSWVCIADETTGVQPTVANTANWRIFTKGSTNAPIIQYVNVKAANWLKQDNGIFTNSLTLTYLTSASIILYVGLARDVPSDEEQDAFNLLSYCTTTNNTIKFVANKRPSIDLELDVVFLIDPDSKVAYDQVTRQSQQQEIDGKLDADSALTDEQITRLWNAAK